MNSEKTFAEFIAHEVSKSAASSTTLVLELRPTRALSEIQLPQIAAPHLRFLAGGFVLGWEGSQAEPESR